MSIEVMKITGPLHVVCECDKCKAGKQSPQIAFNAEVIGYVAPQREWVGLTDEDKKSFVVAYYPSEWDRKTAVKLMNEYEAYLREKNT